ncbi:HesA/MoeB/ThiF family protein [Amorphus orientalis]|uniref:Molybdopterin-synthase adenylyltransferase n=1 Tax=Amorphus orientalis TaxID=649198 RepID=A0AAE3VR25_9HYPH|nr:molybdopterin-synthase adenylyltransferase MoeB [Amorphus orientalis]MDQ0316176.1 adenylyltransferase/sulfurtransferase [Amorphus orientalis]
MSFSRDEIERYARHLVLPEVGGPGQQKLKAARVLVIGAGGLGSPVVQYLAASGVGTIGIVDDDHVALSNLQRQILHGTGDVGRLKVESAAEAVARLNPNVTVEPHAERLTRESARSLVSGYDIVADGSDNFETRYAVSDACFFERKPLVTAAVGRFDGSITVLKPYETAADGSPNPTYRCLFPEAPPEGVVPTCAEAGILGVLTGLVGTLQALEVIKEVVGLGSTLVGRLLLIDALSLRFETMAYGHDPRNPLNGSGPPG